MERDKKAGWTPSLETIDAAGKAHVIASTILFGFRHDYPGRMDEDELGQFRDEMTAALVAAYPFIRAEVVEECLVKLKQFGIDADRRDSAASAIRNLAKEI